MKVKKPLKEEVKEEESGCDASNAEVVALCKRLKALVLKVTCSAEATPSEVEEIAAEAEQICHEILNQRILAMKVQEMLDLRDDAVFLRCSLCAERLLTLPGLEALCSRLEATNLSEKHSQHELCDMVTETNWIQSCLNEKHEPTMSEFLCVLLHHETRSQLFNESFNEEELSVIAAFHDACERFIRQFYAQFNDREATICYDVVAGLLHRYSDRKCPSLFEQTRLVYKSVLQLSRKRHSRKEITAMRSEYTQHHYPIGAYNALHEMLEYDPPPAPTRWISAGSPDHSFVSEPDSNASSSIQELHTSGSNQELSSEPPTKFLTAPPSPLPRRTREAKAKMHSKEGAADTSKRDKFLSAPPSPLPRQKRKESAETALDEKGHQKHKYKFLLTPPSPLSRQKRKEGAETTPIKEGTQKHKDKFLTAPPSPLPRQKQDPNKKETKADGLDADGGVLLQVGDGGTRSPEPLPFDFSRSIASLASPINSEKDLAREDSLLKFSSVPRQIHFEPDVAEEKENTHANGSIPNVLGDDQVKSLQQDAAKVANIRQHDQKKHVKVLFEDEEARSQQQEPQGPMEAAPPNREGEATLLTVFIDFVAFVTILHGVELFPETEDYVLLMLAAILIYMNVCLW